MTVDLTDDIQLATAMLNQTFSAATALVLIFPRESGYSLLSDAPARKRSHRSHLRLRWHHHRMRDATPHPAGRMLSTPDKTKD